MTAVVVITLIAVGLLILAGGKTFAATTVPYDALFTRHALVQGVPKRLMVAIVAHESGFNPRAVNSETEADARKGRDVDSLGLGQILFPDTAHDYEPGATRERMFDPDFNLSLTARVLRDKLRRYPSRGGFPEDAVSAYNAGSSLRKPDGRFVNQKYVNKVHVKWEGFADV